jgi:tetratricopeptide (TPR) repeat protein
MMPRRKVEEFNFGAVRSAPLAYRRDLEAAPGRESLDPFDGAWIAIATMLSHAGMAPDAERDGILRRAVKLTRDATRDGAQSAHRRREGADAEPAARLIHRLVQRMEDAGALNLGLTTLQSFVEADPALEPVERGRIMAQAARIAWKTGDLDAAMSRYRAVARMGHRLNEVELRVRAWIGYGVLARLRGNYPNVRKWASKAARAAEQDGLDELATIAHHSLMVASGVRGEIERALLHGWRAYELSAGDSAAEAEMLVCLGQTLLNAGEADTARSGFAGALTRNPPARIALPAFGGYAMASAVVGDTDGVQWAAEQVLDRARQAGLPYETAAALTECVDASMATGDARRAATLRAAALSTATAHGYHEIAYHLENTEQQRTPAPREAVVLSTRAAHIARAVRDVQPNTKSSHIARQLVRA